MTNITSTDTRKKSLRLRIPAVDLLRGAVMVLMAIDHVRVYAGIPAGGPTPGVFFTRWITHFCAPSFVFLAGTSAFLLYCKHMDKSRLARYLITRGLLLVFLELTLIRFFWTFNFNYANFTLAGVIWMLGWCMVLLAAFIWLRPAVVGVVGLVIIFLQQFFYLVPLIFPPSVRQYAVWISNFFYPSGMEGMPGIAILYVLVPWIGVMMAGYGFGQLLLRDLGYLKRWCLRVGVSAIIIYLIVGSLVIKFSPPGNNELPFLFKLLAQQKYPPSQLYLLMTLGPLIALVPFAHRAKGWFAEILEIFGRVPMFYYCLHILLIHLSALLVNTLLTKRSHQEWYATAPFANVPADHQWSLALLYLVYLIDLIILYFACRWYANYKLDHPEKKWLKYL